MSEQLNEARPIVKAMFQVQDGSQTLWDALVSVLIDNKLVDHADLAVKISQVAATVAADRKGPVYNAITTSAMKSLTRIEYPNLEDAPEWIQKMCAGELVVAKAEPGTPGSFTAEEGPK